MKKLWKVFLFLGLIVLGIGIFFIINPPTKTVLCVKNDVTDETVATTTVTYKYKKIEVIEVSAVFESKLLMTDNPLAIQKFKEATEYMEGFVSEYGNFDGIEYELNMETDRFKVDIWTNAKGVMDLAKYFGDVSKNDQGVILNMLTTSGFTCEEQ